MPAYLAPGLYVERRDAELPALAAVRMDVTAFVGLAERGPLDTPTPVGSWAQFQSVFGGFVAWSVLAYAVRAFFENGGRTAVVVRVAAPAHDSAIAAVAQPADRLSSLLTAVDGLVPGAVVVASQPLSIASGPGPQPADRTTLLCPDTTGLRAPVRVNVVQGATCTGRRVVAVDALAGQVRLDAALPPAIDLTLPFALHVDVADALAVAGVSGATCTWERPLAAAFDLRPATLLARPVRLASGARPAAFEFSDGHGTPALRVEANSPGAWGGAIAVRLLRQVAAVARAARTADPADPSRTVVDALLPFRPGTLVRVTQAGVAAPAHAVVSSVDAATGTIAWASPLPATFTFDHADPAARPLLARLVFSLQVSMQGALVETHDGLSLFDAGAQPWTELPIDSSWIRARLLTAPMAASATLDDLPDPTAAPADGALGWLRGGGDGCAALTPADVAGDRGSDSLRGLRTLEPRSDIGLLALPDLGLRPLPPTRFDVPPAAVPDPCRPCRGAGPGADPVAPPASPPEPAPAFNAEQIARLQQAAIDHCELARDRVALLDAPPLDGPGNCVELQDALAWRQRFDTTMGALYWPWVLAPDPLRLGGAVVRAIPPCGYVAGLCAQADFDVGVHRSPANLPLQWTTAASRPVGAAQQALANPVGLNCLRTLGAEPLTVYGARTLSSLGAWRYVSVRRLLLMIEKSLHLALQWAVFEPDGIPLKLAMAQSVSGFLTALWRRGALAGASPEEAFYVRFAPPAIAAADAELGRLVIEVGVAPVMPAEFVVVRVGRTSDGLDVVEAQEAMT
jgi:hypothetical protein